MKNKLEDLYNHLFATLEALQDKEAPMDLDRARTVAEVAGKVIDAAKTEVRFLEIVGGEASSQFFPAPAKPAIDGDTQQPRRLTKEVR